ncbi:hypothetical protein FJT64_026125 [Amphibalanus amphitrite]|uniref:EGF-like domain-containing protein n=1 Tax=Amphibalanus amphitrite TaxID=1232801 RepID=A0A6A4WIB1_AMPAM|nr:hypothetical protein FJT64_026125 [Amphibalanus amphitrite]
MALLVTVMLRRWGSHVVTLVMMLVVVTGTVGSPQRPAQTIVGKRVFGGPMSPVMRLIVPANHSTFVSTVGSMMSFEGAKPQPPSTAQPVVVTASSLEVTPHTEGTGRPELVTASVPETSLDLPQTPTTSSAAGTFNHSSAVHTFFGPEDAVRYRPVMARRADAPQFRRVIEAVRPTSRQPLQPQLETVTTATTHTITVSESLHCPQGNAFWPATSQCIPIGKQGPCPEGNIIQVNVTASEPVSCACRPGHLAWTDGVCYLRFSPGPCGPGGVICESDSGPAECRCRSGFHQGSDGRCYQEYTQAECPDNSVFIQGDCVAKGPCPEGFFMVFDKREQRYTCGCPPGFLLVTAVNRCIRARTDCRHCVENLYRWPEDGQFYRELTRGPCNDTELLIQTDSGPVCGCEKYAPSDRVSSYLEPTVRWPLDGRCYRLYDQAICPPGHWFIWSSTQNRIPVCCPKGHFFWPADDKCYEEFTRGPCDKSKLFVNVLRTSVCTCDDQWGFTVLNPEDGTCYLRNTQGPCQPGFRFLGAKDGRKVCDCLPGEFYHEPSDKCFPLYRQVRV